MIHVAKEEDIQKLSRRGFLRLFGTSAATVAVAPTKTFFFFGKILKPRALEVIPPLPYRDMIFFNPPWNSEFIGVILSPRTLLRA